MASIIHPGDVFGRLTAVEFVGAVQLPSWRQPYKAWRCRCSCAAGTLVIVAVTQLQGTKKSCGCLRAHTSHKAEQAVWRGMKQRCNTGAYAKKGTKVCAGWAESFHAFFESMGPRPEGQYPSGFPLYTIERKDNDGHYSCGKCIECSANNWPLNCQWIAAPDQHLNKSTTATISVDGHKQPVLTAARTVGLASTLINSRVRNGMSGEKALISRDLRYRMITIGEETMTLTDWARRMSIRPELISERISDGWSERDAVMIPKYKKPLLP